MHFAEQAVAEGKAAAQALQAVLQRVHGQRGLPHIAEAGGRGGLAQQQVGERGLRPLDLGGEHGLTANVVVEEELRVGQQLANGVQPPQRHQRLLLLALQGQIEGQGRRGGQRPGHEGPHGLARYGGALPGSGHSAVHRGCPYFTLGRGVET